MQDITNLPFMRVMQRRGGPDYYVTEYFRVHADYHLEKKILRSITENQTGRPIYAQLIGQDINALVRVAKELHHYPIAGIDLNLGCPARVVYNKDAGGGLLRKKDHMEAIIAALRDAVTSKFTVKTRVGFDRHDEFGRLLEVFTRHAIDTLTIHGRTVKERYQTAVHTDCIQQAVSEMNCPVIANGNVVDVSTGQGMIRRTGADGLMIGRGAIRNPWIFDQLRAAHAGHQPQHVSRADLLHYIMDLYQEVATHAHAFDEPKHVNRMKKYLIYIAQGLDDDFEHQIRRVTSAKSFHHVCHDFLDNAKPIPTHPPNDSKLFCGFDALR
ncbi:MAG: tRNA-dihydrouridine synthase [Verrucomicrobiae bacterium]|nr:tRNA-dihydrouridine synthase [Verrucomicrobiae bacterium]NNJ42824.1 tRNA-dihydrouridine synthase [Akkermansiaceae bacterium]